MISRYLRAFRDLKHQEKKLIFFSLEEEYGEYPPVPDYLPKNFNGMALQILAYLTNTWFGDLLLNPIVLRAIGVNRLRELKLECGPTFYPVIDAVFYMTNPLLDHKFEKMVIFRSGNLYSLCSPGNQDYQKISNF